MTATRRTVLRTLAQGGMGATLAGSLALLGGSIFGDVAQAQSTGQAQQQSRNPLVDKINANTIMLLTAGSGLTYGALAYDLSTVLNDGDNLRILPVQGYSAFQNVRDVRYLRGIDIGFVRTNILGYWRRHGDIPDLNEKIVYVFKVCNEEENIIARSDITSIEQLRGKKVSFNQVGSGTQMSAQDIFSRFKVDVEEVNMKQGDGLQKLKNGEISAVVVSAGKPSPVLRGLKGDYHIVPIPYNVSMIEDYLPSTLTHEDYPNLIPEGQTVDTLASGVVVIAYNWPKNSDHYRRLEKFVNAFFPRLADFYSPPRHEKWKETNLAAEVPGWKRFAAAEEWLRRDQDLNHQRGEFEQFVASRDHTKTISEVDRNKLFGEFLKWMNAGKSQ